MGTVGKTLRSECNQTCLNYRKTTEFMQNAVAESFFKSLKTEMIYGYKKQSKEKMRTELFEYIEIWYNKRRRHSYLKSLIIDEFWDQLNDKNIKLLNVA